METPSVDSIETAMDRIDQLTRRELRLRYSFGEPRDYWVISPFRSQTRIYPSKPVAAMALGWDGINGGYSTPESACRVLERSGYSIVDKSGSLVSKFEDDYSLEDRYEKLCQNIGSTSRDQIVRVRIGQNLFREYLIAVRGNECEVTGVDDTALLRASHIKPWAKCESSQERLTQSNGVLLSALWDAAFDRGLVTFDDNGVPAASENLSGSAKRIMQLKSANRLQLDDSRREFLAWHRKYVFQ